MKNSIKKDFVWNSLGSAFHAFNSLFFLIIVTRNNGILNAGYFSYAFVISNIFLTVASFGGKNYQVTDVKNEFDNNTYISFRLFTTVISTILVILLFIFFNYPTSKYMMIALLILVRSFESVSDVYHGILQRHDKLYIVGISLFLKNLLSLIVFLVLDLMFKNVIFSIIGWMIVNILFLLLVDIRYAKKEIKEKFIFIKKYKNIIKKCLYFFLYSFIVIFMINIPRYFIDFYLTDELQGIYGIITMPATMTILLCQFILQPYAVKLSEYNKKNKKLLKETIKKIYFYIIVVSLLCIIGSYFFGIPLLNYIYNLDLSKYKIHLLIVMLGACFYALFGFISLLLTIKRKTKEQFIIYIISSVFSIIISWILIKNYGFIGGVISYSVAMAITFIMSTYLKTKNKK